jgi:hypothetical protein
MIERGMHAIQVSALPVAMVDAEIMKGYGARDIVQYQRLQKQQKQLESILRAERG